MKIGLLVLAGLAAMFLAACGGGSSSSGSQSAPKPTPAAHDQLTLEGVRVTGQDTAGANVAGWLINRSDKDAATGIALSSTVYNARGQVAGESAQGWGVGTIHPGQKLPIEVPSFRDTSLGDITRGVIQMTNITWSPDKNPKAVIVGSNLAISPPTDAFPGQWTLTANIDNGWNVQLPQARVQAVCWDSNGTLTASGHDVIQVLPANGTSGGTFSMEGKFPPDPNHCMVGGAPNTPMMGHGA